MFGLEKGLLFFKIRSIVRNVYLPTLSSLASWTSGVYKYWGQICTATLARNIPVWKFDCWHIGGNKIQLWNRVSFVRGWVVHSPQRLGQMRPSTPCHLLQPGIWYCLSPPHISTPLNLLKTHTGEKSYKCVVERTNVCGFAEAILLCRMKWKSFVVFRDGAVQFPLWCLGAVFQCLPSSSIICAFPPLAFWCNSQCLMCLSLALIYLTTKFWKLVRGHLCLLWFWLLQTVFHNNFLCTPAQSSVSAVCKCLMGSENMIEMAMSQNCCTLKSLCLDITVTDVPKSAVKNVVCCML